MVRYLSLLSLLCIIFTISSQQVTGQKMSALAVSLPLSMVAFPSQVVATPAGDDPEDDDDDDDYNDDDYDDDDDLDDEETGSEL